MPQSFPMFLTQAATVAGRSNSGGRGNFWADMFGQIISGQRQPRQPATGPGVTEPRWPQSPGGSPTGERSDPWNGAPSTDPNADRVMVPGMPYSVPREQAERVEAEQEELSNDWFNGQRIAFLALGGIMLFIGFTRVASATGAVEAAGRGLATMRNEDYVRRPSPAERKKQVAARREKDE